VKTPNGMHSRRLLLLPLFLTLFTCLTHAQDVPFLGGHVNDYAGVLTSSAISSLEWMLKGHEDSTSNQVVVLTIKTLEGASLEEYSIKVAQTWKLGQKGKDNGVLLLIVKDDRKVRIEVGYGLEGSLTDAISSVIIQQEILPRFRKGDYDEGIKAGATAIIAAIGGTYTSEQQAGSQMDFGDTVMFLGIFTVVVGLFTVIALFSKGFMSWFLYLFLIPFWLAFPYAALGGTIGLIPFFVYFIGFPIFKVWLSKSSTGLHWQQALAGSFLMASSRGGWSSSGGGWSSGGGGFSGGGGSFGGGGSSGSW
jgi:uncharacterized protein